MTDQPSLQAGMRPRFPHLSSNPRYGTPSDFGGSEGAPAQETVLYTPGSEPETFSFDDFLNNKPQNEAPELRSRGPHLHHPQYASPPPSFNGRNNWSSPCDATPGAELSQSHTQLLEGRRDNARPSSQTQHQYYSPQHTPSSLRQTNPIQHPEHAPHSLTAPQPCSMYAPFSGAFPGPESARQYRIEVTRFNRIPYRPPDEDPSIEALIASRQEHIKRIYDAMTRSDAAKDNPGSIAMRRWAHDAFYPPHMVEAFAHKVFDCLLKQVQEGFRGWHHNDYASDDRKGEPEDKSVSCAERLDNIIRGLEEEKTICEDVMGSACQIRMFVNAPRAYARRKEANRHGNSKRGKATPAKPETGARAKSRRLSARARQRQPTPCAPTLPNTGLALRDIEPNMRNRGPQPPYYSAHPVARQVSGPAHPESTPSSNYAGYHLSASLPPPPHAIDQHFAASTSLPHNGHSFMSAPSMSHCSLPTTPVTHGEFKGANDASAGACSSSSWHQPPPQVDHSLLDHSHAIFPQDSTPGPDIDFWNFGMCPQQQQTANFPQMGEPPPPHVLPMSNAVDPSELNIDPIFRDYWNSQHNVQGLPSGQTGQDQKAQPL